MLQQTTVATVTPYFHAFITRWPRIEDLAEADLDAVLHAWQGLGYYARARNLHRAAQNVARDLGGIFPDDEAGLLALPGIGPYTAAAIAAIAFDRKASPVDGNVERVIARLRRVEVPLPAAKPELKALAAELTPAKRAGDFAQAMMDLGATVCLPRRPNCTNCPWQEPCLARQAGLAGELPRRQKRKTRPTRHGVIFWCRQKNGAVLLRKRPPSGLLGGLMEFPGTPWRDQPWSWPAARADAPGRADWNVLPGTVEHTFTHFHLILTVATGSVASDQLAGSWHRPEDFHRLALPTLMKKVARHVLDTTIGAGHD